MRRPDRCCTPVTVPVCHSLCVAPWRVYLSVCGRNAQATPPSRCLEVSSGRLCARRRGALWRAAAEQAAAARSARAPWVLLSACRRGQSSPPLPAVLLSLAQCRLSLAQCWHLGAEHGRARRVNCDSSQTAVPKGCKAMALRSTTVQCCT